MSLNKRSPAGFLWLLFSALSLVVFLNWGFSTPWMVDMLDWHIANPYASWLLKDGKDPKFLPGTPASENIKAQYLDHLSFLIKREEFEPKRKEFEAIKKSLEDSERNATPSNVLPQ